MCQWYKQEDDIIDKDGNISSWAIGHKDPKVKSFLQKMSERSDEIRQRKLAKSENTKEEKAEIKTNQGSHLGGVIQ